MVSVTLEWGWRDKHKNILEFIPIFFHLDAWGAFGIHLLLSTVTINLSLRSTDGGTSSGSEGHLSP